jgi:predicted transposase/invertase (TIGR01784 family)
MISKYFNPYTDFGFKKLFGEEGSKDLLMDFLNQLLPAHHQIQELTFKNGENVPDTKEERKSVFDIYCTAHTGERFIVEMQKAKMHYFKDRSLFYSTFPVREQAQKGEWNFYLLPVYFIAILDFKYDEKEEEQKFRRDVCLKDQDGDVFYDKLHFKFLQMPLFNKTESELETHFDKWMYFLKHLESMGHIPAILNEPVFQKGFDIAEVSHLSSEQYEAYLKSRLAYNEAKAASDTAFADGKSEGERTKALEVAKVLKAQGVELSIIVLSTGLTAEVIEAL